jgi:hypothetical protein
MTRKGVRLFEDFETLQARSIFAKVDRTLFVSNGHTTAAGATFPSTIDRSTFYQSLGI